MHLVELERTFLSLSIAYAVASGTQLLCGKWVVPQARKVLFIDGEMPLLSLQERSRHIIPEIADKTLLNTNLIILPQDKQESGIPALARPEGQQLIEEHLDDVELLIFDNISSLFRSYKENEADSWNSIQEWLLSLRRRNISVLIIHHSNKGGEQRGTSRKEDILDTSIMLKLPKDYSPEDGACFEVHYTKHRHFFGEEACPFVAKLIATKDDGSLTWKISPMIDGELETILSLRAEGKSQRTIAREVGISSSKVHRRLKDYDSSSQQSKA